MEEKRDEAYNVNEDDSGIKDAHSNIQKVDHNAHNDNSYLLASSVWSKTEFRDHNMLVYPDLATYRKIYSEGAKRALDTVKWSSWLQLMTRLIGSKTL